MGSPKHSVTAVRSIPLDDRMTNKGARESFPDKKRWFERKNRQQVIEKARDLFGASGTPCPNGGRNVVDKVYFARRQFLNALGNPETKVG